jgi:hypothetical protein
VFADAGGGVAVALATVSVGALGVVRISDTRSTFDLVGNALSQTFVADVDPVSGSVWRLSMSPGAELDRIDARGRRQAYIQEESNRLGASVLALDDGGVAVAWGTLPASGALARVGLYGPAGETLDSFTLQAGQDPGVLDVDSSGNVCLIVYEALGASLFRREGNALVQQAVDVGDGVAIAAGGGCWYVDAGTGEIRRGSAAGTTATGVLIGAGGLLRRDPRDGSLWALEEGFPRDLLLLSSGGAFQGPTLISGIGDFRPVPAGAGAPAFTNTEVWYLDGLSATAIRLTAEGAPIASFPLASGQPTGLAVSR